jgi:3-deoxy-manno-octulosonate cytidylyltransferase (CMP-KDO synthetase)
MTNTISEVLAVIPARYASTRFPGKPLVAIAGKPMIQHVWERVQLVSSVSKVIIATDDERIQKAALAFGAEVCMTSPDHPSGTDRLWEVAQAHADFDWILNVQGDEPFLEPEHLETVLQSRATLLNQKPDIITVVTHFDSHKDWQNPNMVKAVLAPIQKDTQQEQALYRALYFSRAPIPYNRDAHADQFSIEPQHAFRHLGLYLYRRSALESFVSLPPSTLENLEKLEQLRALEAGLSIFAVSVSHAQVGIDTPDDLLRLEDHPFTKDLRQ